MQANRVRRATRCHPCPLRGSNRARGEGFGWGPAKFGPKSTTRALGSTLAAITDRPLPRSPVKSQIFHSGADATRGWHGRFWGSRKKFGVGSSRFILTKFITYLDIWPSTKFWLLRVFSITLVHYMDIIESSHCMFFIRPHSHHSCFGLWV